jgi:hypothetical protein
VERNAMRVAELSFNPLIISRSSARRARDRWFVVHDGMAQFVNSLPKRATTAAVPNGR